MFQQALSTDKGQKGTRSECHGQNTKDSTDCHLATTELFAKQLQLFLVQPQVTHCDVVVDDDDDDDDGGGRCQRAADVKLSTNLK